MRRTLDNRLTRWSQRFVLACTGATAVEFALLALPFFALLFGIFELGLIYMLSASLDNAMMEASRTIRTGGIIGTPGASAQGFKDLICGGMKWTASDCSGNLSVNVEKLDNYQLPVTQKPLYDANGVATPSYTATSEGEIVLVRATYRWKVITPLLNGALSAGPGNYRLVTSTLVFRNEPFGGG